MAKKATKLAPACAMTSVSTEGRETERGRHTWVRSRKYPRGRIREGPANFHSHTMMHGTRTAGKDGERRNDGSAMPRVLDAAPLQSEDEASDAADHDRRADPVERKEAEGESRARRAPATERPSSEFPLCVDSDLLEHGRRRLRAELKVHNYQPRGGVSERGKRSDGR